MALVSIATKHLNMVVQCENDDTDLCSYLLGELSDVFAEKGIRFWHTGPSMTLENLYRLIDQMLDWDGWKIEGGAQ